MPTTDDCDPPKEVARCDEHGFALSPEGLCVRCALEARRAGLRRRAQYAAAAAFVLLTVGVGARVAIAHAGSTPPAPVAPDERDVFPVVAGVDRATMVHEQGGNWAAPEDEDVAAASVDDAPEEPLPPAASAPPAAPDAWDLALARADAEREADRDAKAAKEKLAFAEALTVAPTAAGASRPVSRPCHPRHVPRSSAKPHVARRVPIGSAAWGDVVARIAARGDPRQAAVNDCGPCAD